MINQVQIRRYDVYPYSTGIEGEENIYMFYFMHETHSSFISAVLFGDRDGENAPIPDIEEKITEWRLANRVDKYTTLFSGVYLNEEEAMLVKFLIDR